MVLAGLLARGVRVSTVVLIDTIHEELIAAFQSPSAPPAPSTFAASGGSIVEEDPATGRVRLDVPFGAGRLPLSGHLAIRVRCAGQRGACSRRVPMPPAHGLVVVDLVANFCGWLSLVAPRMQDQRL
jgi:hypothetical protein